MAQVQIQVLQRYRVSRADLSLAYHEPFHVVFDLGRGRSVTLRSLTESEQQTETEQSIGICEVSAPIDIRDTRKALLDQIVEGRMPEGARPDPDTLMPELAEEYFAQFTDSEGNLRDGSLPDIRILPSTLQDFIKGTSDSLYNLAERTLRLLRWRAGASGTPAILARHLYFEWSEDGTVWHPIWSGNTVSVSLLPVSPMREEYREFVVKVFDDETGESLGHELYHEAEILRERSP